MSAVDRLRRAPGSPSASGLPHGSQHGQQFTSQVLRVPSCRGDATGKPKSSLETQPRSAGTPPGWTVGEGPCRAGRVDPRGLWASAGPRQEPHRVLSPVSPGRRGWRPALALRGPPWTFPSTSPLPVVSKTQGGGCRRGFSREADGEQLCTL